jgi:hypothetical protein
MMAGAVLPATVVFLVAMVHLSGAAVVASTYSAASMGELYVTWGDVITGLSLSVVNPLGEDTFAV